MNENTAKRKPAPQRIKFTPINTVSMIIAVLAVPGATICLKVSSQEWANKLDWWDVAFWSAIGYFALGNLVGFGATIGKTIALRDNPPSLVYALVGAPSAILMHLALAWKFNITLTPMQWVAISIIVFGAIMLQGGSSSGEDEAIADAIQHLDEGEVDPETGPAQ